MAQNMELAFEKLIEGTTWELPRNVAQKSKYAFSQTECVVTVEDSGEIKTQMKSYPLIEDTGEENKFDPDTGYKLLTRCKICDRNIYQNNQRYCLGCGDKLFSDYTFMDRVFLVNNPEVLPKLVALSAESKTEKSIEDDDRFEVKDGKLLVHDIKPKKKMVEKIAATGYTTYLEECDDIIRNLSILLSELMNIEKLVNPSIPYKESHKRLKSKDAILMDEVIGNKYYHYFKQFYFMMTNNQVAFATTVGLSGKLREKVLAGGPEQDELAYFHPYNRIPFGVTDLGIEDELKGYKDGFMLYGLLDINPQKFNNKVIENWWKIFQYDLSMTRGLLREMQRHQNRLQNERDRDFMILNKDKKGEDA
jgi:hypothetical protein